MAGLWVCLSEPSLPALRDGDTSVAKWLTTLAITVAIHQQQQPRRCAVSRPVNTTTLGLAICPDVARQNAMDLVSFVEGAGDMQDNQLAILLTLHSNSILRDVVIRWDLVA